MAAALRNDTASTTSSLSLSLSLSHFLSSAPLSLGLFLCPLPLLVLRNQPRNLAKLILLQRFSTEDLPIPESQSISILAGISMDSKILSSKVSDIPIVSIVYSLHT
ncbi:hypothetical protein Nepgr_022385 [Nepenthes gracilis]|uniref:Uncharacterized protein n=1 Tax=Nepenthes gracilis TaxID=150966 RepID=A0AAD3T0N5_NEPGR|nr:hypothetical protein Nepgr_022385 [Nepenthes gracilis]